MTMVDVTVPMDDAALYGAATSDEKPPAAEPERQESREARPEPDAGPVRDEQGRFAPREKAPEQAAQQPTQVESQPKGEQQPDPDQSAQVPSWRLREITQEREAYRQQVEQERQSRVRIEAELQQLRQAAMRQQQKPPPDMLADPEAWQQHLVQEQRASIDRVRFELSEDQARDKFGDEKVNAALKWIETVRDPATWQAINAARNPYREMVKLYDERQTLSQIGGDLNAYKAKLLDEALKDPAYRQRFADMIRDEQNGAGNGNPTNGQRPVVQLPPSLSRATGARIADAANGDMSGEALYAHATAPEPRRR